MPKNKAQTNGEPDADAVQWLTVVGAGHNNLQGIDVAIPLQRFVCVTGVSGSGKSSLVLDIVCRQLLRDLNGAGQEQPGRHERINGKQHLDKVIDIDQSPIGRTPRSNPATYIKVFDEIRDLFANLPDARVRGYKPGRFSFNVPTGKTAGGRCEACEGNGSNRIEMEFLADVWVTCPVCDGRRFNRETLQVLFKGRSIADVLNMDVQEALAHFDNLPRIRHMLQTLHDVGLDYLKLGQSSTTLSGGEAQRIKLARELVKRSTGRTLYILDEPTTGLHFEDIRRLLAVLHGFVDAGNTVLVVEHNLDVIKTADWVIDLGPEGGAGGGRIVAEGTPEDVARVPQSFTGQALAPVLGMAPAPPPQAAGRASRTRAANNHHIRVVGARQHNLKDVCVDIPRMQTTVFTGPSGSGKSSLAMDTLYTEGQRRYVESLSAYARQFLGQLQKPKVDHVEGLSPAIAIEQKPASQSPRSTVGTVTEIHDYLRVLFARLGTPHCPGCDRPIGTQTSDEIVQRICASPAGTRVLLLAPIERGRNEKYRELFARERANGYARVRVDGVVHELNGDLAVNERSRHAVELVVDRVAVGTTARGRIADSVEQALAVGEGVLVVQSMAADASESGSELRFSQHFACNHCGVSFEPLSPHHFSFNSRLGWCDACEGLGTQQGASMDALVARADRSIFDGAIAGWEGVASNPVLQRTLSAVADHIGFNPHNAWHRLTAVQQRLLLHGIGDDEWIDVPAPRGERGFRVQWKGFFPAIEQAARASWHYRHKLDDLVSEIPCKACGGARLTELPRHVRFSNGRRAMTVQQLCEQPLSEALAFFKDHRLDAAARRIAGEMVREVVARLEFLVDVGLGYLTLGRSAPTLSNGEGQRIRLASQLGSGLTGVLYVLDEPTIGLHPRDNRRLIAALDKLRDLGNTLCIVEHDAAVIDSADHVLDFGPGAGAAGGQIVAQATPQRIRRHPRSLTGKYLSGRECIFIPQNRRPVSAAPAGAGGWIQVLGACQHNLKNIDAAFPLGRFIAVSGVSGSGKSSLVNDILYNALAARVHRARVTPGRHRELLGLDQIDKVISVDQAPIGSSPSSNPATYTEVFDVIRELYARLPDAKVRGYTAGRFSFNRPGGRCETCEGMGETCIEMHFLPDVWVTCEECAGQRFNHETLQVRYHGKSIADVLNMRVSDALELFTHVPKIRSVLKTLDDVGLGYVQLGQSAATLSGGEAQRVKLASELARQSTGRTVYVLDEPSTGLHFDDLRKLLDVLHRLVDLGNTVICIEHNLDLIKTADWVIDLGPEAGAAGGEIVAVGSPEQVAACDSSHTGCLLAEVLASGRRAARPVYSAEEAAREHAVIGGRLKLAAGDEDVQLPWEKDGRRWHTSQRPASDGQRPRWEPQALEWLVKQMEAGGRLLPADWTHRSRVELRAAGSAKTAWFGHILTGGAWLLECTLRVAKRSVDFRRLAGELGLKTLDERTDLPIYGQWQRVKRKAGREFDDVRIWVHDLAEVDTPAFRSFLKAAIDGYVRQIGILEDDPQRAAPWMTDGKAWHMSQKAIAGNRRKHWQPTLLPELIGRLTKAIPKLMFDWTGKTAIQINHPALDRPWGRLVTANRYGLRIEIKTGCKQLTPAKVDRLGADPEIKRKTDHDVLSFVVQEMHQVDTKQLTSVLKEVEASYIGV